MESKETPEERVLRTRAAAYTKWAHTDPVEGTAKARKAALDRFEKEVDPDGKLPEAERKRRAECAKKAHFTRMALKSVQARRKNKAKNAEKDDAANAVLPENEPRPARVPNKGTTSGVGVERAA